MAKVRVKKREVVIPFEGEEMFVVPKRKGFGQPDMEGYVMATGGRTTGLETDTSNPTLETTTSTTPTIQTGNTGVSIPTGSSADVPPPSGTTSTTSTSDGASTIGGVAIGSGTNAGDVPTGNQTQTGTTTIIGASPLPETGINSTIQTGAGSGGQIEVGNMGAGQQPETVTTNTDTEIPLFPDLSTMNCTQLASEITRLSGKIATSVFPINVANAYNNQITLAKSIETTKCNRTLPNEPLIITPPAPAPIIIPSIGGGIFGGGIGGGGFGEPPIDEAPIVEEKNNMGIYLIVGGIALIYFLTRKK
jgi:hypothetical protein